MSTIHKMRGDEPVGDWVDKALNWLPLMDLHSREVKPDFAVQDWILCGKVGALVAAGGTGKTTLLLMLGISIATGRPFFGQAAKKGAFLLLSNDDSQDDLEGALARVCRGLKLNEAEMMLVGLHCRIISLIGENGTKTFSASVGGSIVPTDLSASILEAVAGLPNLVGIALDTLRQFSGGSSNDEQVIKLTIAGATEVAHKTGCFVILPHHTGKQNYRDGITDMYAGSGSAAIADNCRFVLLLQTATWKDIEAKVRRAGQEQGEPLVLTSTRGSLLVKAPEPMFLCREGFKVIRIAGATLTREQLHDKKDRQVLQAVRDGCGTKNEIHARIGGRRIEVLSRIDDLVQRGHITTVPPSGSAKWPRMVVSDSGGRFLQTGE